MSIRNSVLLVLLFLCSCSGAEKSGYDAKMSGRRVRVRMEEYQPAFRNTMKGLREFYAPGQDAVREEYPYPYGSLIKEYRLASLDSCQNRTLVELTRGGNNNSVYIRIVDR